MTTMDAAPTLRTVSIEFLFLDQSSCRRCSGTAASIDAALAAIGPVLEPTGARIALRRIHVRSVAQARETGLISSPTIRVNGRDIAPGLRESECGAGACSCGPSASCRVWHYRGHDHDAAPVGLIVDAVLAELYGGGAVPAAPPDAPYELPEKLERTLAAGGGCCG